MYESSPARGGFHAAVAGTRPPSGSWRRWSAPAPPSPNTATRLCAQDRPPPRTTTTLQPAKPRYPDLSPAPAVRIRASGRSAPCGLRRQRCVALRPAWCHGRWPRALFRRGYWRESGSWWSPRAGRLCGHRSLGAPLRMGTRGANALPTSRAGRRSPTSPWTSTAIRQFKQAITADRGRDARPAPRG